MRVKMRLVVLEIWSFCSGKVLEIFLKEFPGNPVTYFITKQTKFDRTINIILTALILI